MSIFFTADTHFNHEKIILYCNRPFKNIDDMNEQLISKWNEKVKAGDLVYHIGDFSWRNPDDILDKLNGQIILIKGSHDWSDIEKHKKIVKVEKLLNKTINNQKITMCHYCMRVWHLSHYNSWHLFGHSHGKLEPVGKSWDVGVDANNYEILSFDEIVEIMKQQEDNFNLKRDN